jgi:hypothetical protein
MDVAEVFQPSTTLYQYVTTCSHGYCNQLFRKMVLREERPSRTAVSGDRKMFQSSFRNCRGIASGETHLHAFCFLPPATPFRERSGSTVGPNSGLTYEFSDLAIHKRYEGRLSRENVRFSILRKPGVHLSDSKRVELQYWATRILENAEHCFARPQWKIHFGGR